MPSALCDSATQPMFGDGRPGECTFIFFLFIQNPGQWTRTDINNIGYKTHRGPALTNYYRVFGNDFNCGYFRLVLQLTASP